MLHKETVDPNTFQLLVRLSREDGIKQFKLVGGTALSLQLGHRISTDLDFFSNEDFNAKKIMDLLDQYGKMEYSSTGKNLVQGYLNGVKIDFACHKYLWLEKGISFQKTEICSVRDISAMKLAAVLVRAKKRDFIDVAAILKRENLDNILKNFTSKYNQRNTLHVLRAIGYFADAENDKTPLKLLDKSVDWNGSKGIIQAEIRNLNKKRGMSRGM